MAALCCQRARLRWPVCDILYPNRTMIRVRAIGLTAGPWVTTTLGTLIPDFWLSDAAPFWLGDSTAFWSR